ncbi:hypothetical protein ACFL96_04315 [Thermoproteota archaeon]
MKNHHPSRKIADHERSRWADLDLETKVFGSKKELEEALDGLKIHTYVVGEEGSRFKRYRSSIWYRGAHSGRKSRYVAYHCPRCRQYIAATPEIGERNTAHRRGGGRDEYWLDCTNCEQRMITIRGLTSD